MAAAIVEEATVPLSLSVVVCTYNRCSKLVQALAAIEHACRDRPHEVELVVVDNNSSDDTKTVIDEFARSSSLVVRYAYEARQGLSFARNRGIRESRGRIIAFTDDDCLVGRGWSDAILREFKDNPDIALIGGRVDLHSAGDRPVSIRPFDKRVRYAGVEHVLELIIGCNLAFRREVVERIGAFDPAFGSTNGVIGDDIDFVYRTFRQGMAVEFIPDVVVRHDHGRRHDHDIERLQAGYMRGRGAFFAKHAFHGDGAILKSAYWEIVTGFRLIVRRLIVGEPIRRELLFLRHLLSGALRLARYRITG